MPSPTVRAEPGDTGVELEAVSGTYRAVRRGNVETHRFAFRRPGDWTHLDLDGRNGDLYVGLGPECVGHLIVDGALAVSHPQLGPGHRRLHAIVEEGFMAWSEPPLTVERTEWDGRPAERLRWEVEDRWVEAVYDEATKLCVSTSTPAEVDEITGLAVDDDVDPELFTPPAERLDDWRGGPAYVVEEFRARGHYTASWEPTSGPGSVWIAGPEAVSLDDAVAWARAHTDEVWARDVGDEHRRL